jgi:hypothetical protein
MEKIRVRGRLAAVCLALACPFAAQAQVDLTALDRDMTGPGARVLAVVGASHKPWFDSWLGQLQGVDIVDVEKVLK